MFTKDFKINIINDNHILKRKKTCSDEDPVKQKQMKALNPPCNVCEFFAKLHDLIRHMVRLTGAKLSFVRNARKVIIS